LKEIITEEIWLRWRDNWNSFRKRINICKLRMLICWKNFKIC